MKSFVAAMVAMVCIAVIAAFALEQVPMSSADVNSGSNVRLN